MEAALVYLVTTYPWFSAAIITLGTLRMAIKPLMSAILTYVESSETQKDNIFIEKVKKNIYWKAAFWVLDYVTSIKLPAPKK